MIVVFGKGVPKHKCCGNYPKGRHFTVNIAISEKSEYQNGGVQLQNNNNEGLGDRGG